jgi:hypothetical protein
MMDRREIERMVRDEVAASDKDPEAAAAARREIEAEQEAEDLVRAAREAQGLYVPGEEV